MKKLLLISALFATSAMAQEPIKVRVSECDANQIILITKVGPDTETVLLEYCSFVEAQNKLDYLLANPEFHIGKKKIQLTPIPLFSR